MKKSIFLLCAFFITISYLSAQSPGRRDGFISIEKIPQSIKEFLEIRNKIATSPQGGVAMMVLAMNVYTKDKNLGMKCFTICIDRQWLIRANKKAVNSYKGWLPSANSQYLIKQLHKKPYLKGVYFLGTHSKNHYALPKPPYKMHYTSVTMNYSRRKGYARVFIASTGKNRPRPITVRKNNRGIWKAYEFSSLFVGVIDEPKEEVDDDL